MSDISILAEVSQPIMPAHMSMCCKFVELSKTKCRDFGPQIYVINQLTKSQKKLIRPRLTA